MDPAEREARLRQVLVCRHCGHRFPLIERWMMSMLAHHGAAVHRVGWPLLKKY